MTKQDMVAEIKLLRNQMARLDAKCQKREDKLMELIIILEPFLNAMTPEQHKAIFDLLGIE